MLNLVDFLVFFLFFSSPFPYWQEMSSVTFV